MPIRRILLPLTGTAAGEAALTTALMVARMWNAHLTTLHVRVDSRDVAPLAGEGLSGAMIEEMMSATEKESSDRSDAVRAMFDRFVAQQGVVVAEPHPGEGATASFASVTGREDDLVAQLARLTDLTVVPHPEAGDDVSSSDALHAVLFDSGRPVLIAPQRPLPTLGTRVVIAWNGTAESAAAVQAAIPWMQRAEKVQVVTSDEYQRRGGRDRWSWPGIWRCTGSRWSRRSSGRSRRMWAVGCWRRRGRSARTSWRWAPIRIRGCGS